MKKLSFLLLFVVAAVCMPHHVLANDYLEVSRHYQAYCSGRNTIHFKIPVWAYGRWNDYHLDTLGTTISWQVQGENPEVFMHIGGDANGTNTSSDERGTAFVWMLRSADWSGTKGGMIYTTNEYNGNEQQIGYINDWYRVDVKKQSDDDCPHVTILEFDWYPPAELNNKKFKVSIHADIRKRTATSANYTLDYTFPSSFTGGDNTAAPQLYTPYLHMVNESGVIGRGLAAIPFFSQAKPINYTNPLISDTIQLRENAGTMLVPTSDSGYYAFEASFKVYRNEEIGQTETIKSNAITIPAYHRIYDFQAIAQQDEHASYTGANVLTWRLKFPGAKDMIQSDFFEIQRAFKSDFSDALTVQLLPMTMGDSIYRYVDDNRTAWNGTELRTDTIAARLSVSEKDFTVYDDDENPVADVTMTLTANKLVLPSAPVYYRVRRTSAAVWDWNHDFARSFELYKSTFLAPLKQTQANYTLDSNFVNNKVVHFCIGIDNMQIGPRALSIDECELSYNSIRPRINDGCVNYILDYSSVYWDKNGIPVRHYSDIYIYVRTADGQEPYGPRPGTLTNSGTTKFRVPVGSTVERRIRLKEIGIPIDFDLRTDSLATTYMGDEAQDKREEITFNYNSSFFSWVGLISAYVNVKSEIVNKAPVPSREVDSILTARKDDFKQLLFPQLGPLNGGFGRCTWDRTARLILRRTMVETGQVIDFSVPQDSIIRLPDGSWMAHMTDVADAPCTHYRYQVLIDQSHATLRVADSVYLQPITIKGPELYSEQAAEIRSFTASQGDARDKFKSGVQLQWTINSTAVDSFIVQRVLKGSTDAPEIIYQGDDNFFFDETAVPDRHYEYTVTAVYTCNGNTTNHSLSAEGWRSPYGQISGMIQMPDNTGMAGVQVILSANGQTLATLTTDATGAYLFDSLRYDLTAGTIYTVTPTSQYGTFSYNSTSSGIATVALDAGHPVANAIHFVNTSSVRLTGRVLYDLSTIPVADACFVLNGDTIRRGNIIYRTGTDGNFELVIPMSMPCRLQVAKPGHTFKNDGWLFVTEGDTTFSLVKPLDGVRFYDTTKVRLVGRVAGGLDQQALKHGFGLGKNNLGDDLQLVLMLEGDNTAHIVHDPDDLTRDTLHRSVDATDILFEQKRITIRPDVVTGEFAADLFPVKYKVVQANANGYATLFPTGTSSETFDLTNAPLTVIRDTYNDSTITYNAVYDRIYRSPVQVKMTQLLYGMEKAGYGEQYGEYTDIDGHSYTMLLYHEQNGEAVYTLGYPVFMYNRQYQFMVSAYEEYCYNNNKQTGLIDRVPLRSGSVTIRNGLHSATESRTYELDNKGKNASVLLKIDNIDLANSGTAALRSVSAALVTEGNTVETDLFRAFVSGNVVKNNTLRTSAADIILLDVIRDPGGMGSSSWLEKGSTYKFGFSSRTYFNVGVEAGIKWADGITQSVGVVAAPAGAGTYAGNDYETQHGLTLSMPFTWEVDWTNKYYYEYTTTTRIATSSSSSGVGANADIYLGTTRSVVTGLAKSVTVISDSLWQARQVAYNNGALKLLAQGTDSAGHTYYLVTGEKNVFGSTIANTFAYTQKYILESVIPALVRERANLLEIFPDTLSAYEAADERGEPVYWYKGEADQIIGTDTLKTDVYEMITPRFTDEPFMDRIASIDRRIINWISIINSNEKEKVMARTTGLKYGTYSVSGGSSYSQSDSYVTGASYSELPQEFKGLLIYNLEQSGTKVLERATLDNLKNISDFFKNKGKEIGTDVGKIINQELTYAIWNNNTNQTEKETRDPKTLHGKSGNMEFEYVIEPIFNYTNDEFRSKEGGSSRKVGYTISPDPHGDISVSVYRANLDSVFQLESKVPRDQTNMENDTLLFGSYVFYTEAGSSYCPHEGEERTLFYNAGTSVIGGGTLYAAKPELAINTHEMTNVAADKPAIFRITLMNNADQQNTFQSGEFMHLSLAGGNPDGAKVYIDGVPIAAGYPIYLVAGTPVVKTMEVYRGQADDYNDLELQLCLDDCPKVYGSLKFSVHYLPQSSPVNIAYPRDKWVMNTLSARDSMGYYLPITIDGFDIHHKNFDHIEFQYKLSTENNDAWVTQCSFFADDSLYDKATGNKAMIENGRITPFRFYGERDPKELNYDLRAVSFCRYGSGFVTKESPVISGIKDTRPPVLFGKPLPANGILKLDGDIKLRFSEPIAGNWLDEDNNFQVLGVTNATGITQTTSLYFDGQSEHYAVSQASRELAITDLTIDMLIKPAETNREMILFAHGNEEESFAFSLTADNRLKLSTESDGRHREYLSKQMGPLPANDFTRVIMSYELFENVLRFYAGTKDITDDDFIGWVLQDEAAPMRFGCGLNGENPFHGNMMEVRVWTKALTPAEIANTHLRRLTGYEHGLMAYYPMTESKGNALDDLASGATLTAKGLSWTNPQGISLTTTGEKIRLQPTLFSRTEAEDYTFMCWFRSDNSSYDDVSLFGTAMGDSVTMQLALHDGSIRFTADDVDAFASADLTDGNWHHCVLVVSKTYNAGSLYIDGQLKLNFPTIGIGALSGTSVWLADGLEGNIDDVCLFEQALPAELIAEFGKQTPNGDEMGLINLLTFSCVKRNSSGVMEQVFSPDNQRVFRDANGNVVNKIQPLLVDDLASQADKSNYAPVRDRGLLTNLPFNWTYQESELLVNIKTQPREINKRTMYLTVRDVEDLNGNKLPSPVMWTVYANLNSIVWSEPAVRIMTAYEGLASFDFQVFIINQTGMTRQYTIDHLPRWLAASTTQGTLEAEGNKMVTFTASLDLKPGLHNHVVYLTDDQGLSAPLLIEVEVIAECPYDEPETGKFPYNMSLCGQVKIGEVFDTDPEDKVIALYNNECVGMANVDFDRITNKSSVHLTVFGNDKMNRKQIHFRLWQASTGKMYNLSTDRNILFAHGFVYGCDGNRVIFTAGGSETQNISLHSGWNWISTNLDLTATKGALNTCVTAAKPWSDADLIKNPNSRQFSSYDAASDAFVGSLAGLHFSQMYMMYAAQENTLQIAGEKLSADSLSVRVRGDGQWSPMPCLFDEPVSVTKALTSYYDYASQGDMIKAHNRFAYFSEDRKWEGDLTSLRPGEGYLFRRLAPGSKEIKFYRQSSSANAPHRRIIQSTPYIPTFTNPAAATNMTMIAKVSYNESGLTAKRSYSDNGPAGEAGQTLCVYVGGELSAIASPLASLYFITIQSDRIGELRFEIAGERLMVDGESICYTADSHYGTLKAPIVLRKADETGVYKILENNHVVIIRNNEKYDVTGKKL